MACQPDRRSLRLFYRVTLGLSTIPERIAYAQVVLSADR